MGLRDADSIRVRLIDGVRHASCVALGHGISCISGVCREVDAAHADGVDTLRRHKVTEWGGLIVIASIAPIVHHHERARCVVVETRHGSGYEPFHEAEFVE